MFDNVLFPYNILKVEIGIWTYPMALFQQIKRNYFSDARRKWMHNKVFDFKLSTWWWIYTPMNFPKHKSHQTTKGRNQNLFLWTLEVHIYHQHMQLALSHLIWNTWPFVKFIMHQLPLFLSHGELSFRAQCWFC